MSQFTKNSSVPPRTKIDPVRSRRSFVALLEAVEERKLLTALTSVNWNSGGTQHYEVFSLGFNNSVSVSKDGGGFVSEGGYLKSISAGTDSNGLPEVFGIGADNAVWVNDNGAGWVSRGGSFHEISATVNGTVYGIAADNMVYVNHGGVYWTNLGGYLKSISAGTDAYGLPEVFGIGADNAVWVNDLETGWYSRGGYLTAISASANNTVYGVGANSAVWVNQGGGSWTDLGGYVKQISAGTDAYGHPMVYAIGGDAAAYGSVNGGAFNRIGSYVTEITGTGRNTVFARGGDVSNVYDSQYCAPFNYVGSIALADPAAAAAYSPAPAGAPLFNNSQPSYLDVQQGALGDCWLEASLAEVAARKPQDIKNMFIYDGTTVDNGSTVGLYSVLLHSPNGIGFYIQVDTAFPAGGGYYDRVGNALGTQALWVALAEKGYAEANALGLVTTNAANQGSYAALNNGWPAWALQAITGNAASQNDINPTNIANAWNSGQLVVLCTTNPSSSAIVGNHCYALVGYDASSGQPFKLFNAWGTQSNGYAPGRTGTTYGLFTANAAFISSNFSGQGIGTGATNAVVPTTPTDPPTEPLTLDIAGPKTIAIIHRRDSGRLAVNYTRPAGVTAAVGGPLSLLRFHGGRYELTRGATEVA